MEVLLDFINVLAKAVLLWFGSGVIIMQCLWPINDKPVPRYMYIICGILLTLYWWWVL